MTIRRYLGTTTARVTAAAGVAIAATAVRGAGRAPVFYAVVGATWVVVAVAGYVRAARREREDD